MYFGYPFHVYKSTYVWLTEYYEKSINSKYNMMIRCNIKEWNICFTERFYTIKLCDERS